MRDWADEIIREHEQAVAEQQARQQARNKENMLRATMNRAQRRQYDREQRRA